MSRPSSHSSVADNFPTLNIRQIDSEFQIDFVVKYFYIFTPSHKVPFQFNLFKRID